MFSKAADTQLQMLRRMGASRTAAALPPTLSALMVGCGVAGFVYDQPAFFIGCAFAGLVALTAWQSTPHIRNAAGAIDAGMPSKGMVEITITQWSDSPQYRATIRGSAQDAWSFAFIPQGWRPKEGRLEAHIFHAAEVAWPVLIVTQEGIIYPRFTPKVAAKDA